MTGYLGFASRVLPRSSCNVAQVGVDTWWEEIDPARSRRKEVRRVKVTAIDRFHATIEGYVERDGVWVKHGRRSRVLRATFAESSRAFRRLHDFEVAHVQS